MKLSETTFSYVLMYGEEYIDTYNDLETICKIAKKLAREMKKQYGKSCEEYTIHYSGNIIAAY